ncbi:MAG TPA: cell division protein SepF [Candidatus Deferrimicrobium sp.]|nr:cell division protein SepF [Candidatus Deferrimicrobium sp.]
MAKKFMDKVMSMMGFDDEMSEDIIEQEEKEQDIIEEPRQRKGAPVLSIHTQKQMKVVIMEPASFDDAQNIADQLKNRRPVIVNLEGAERNLAKRIVDFVCGTAYALNGSMQKVGNGIFLFVPSNVDIAGEAKEEISDKGLLWSVIGQK